MAKAKKELTVVQKLGCTKFPLEIEYNDGRNKYVEKSEGFWKKTEFDTKGNVIRVENSSGYWEKCEYDSNGKQIYFENSCGQSYKYEYHANGKNVIFKNSVGFWSKREYDLKGNMIYNEDSNGDIEDNRPKVELSLKEIADKFGIPLSQLRVKD